MTSNQSPTSSNQEALVISTGAATYRRHRERQTELGYETLIAPVRRLLAVSTGKLAEAVGDWIAWVAARPRQHPALPFVERCGPELAAHYACQVVLDELSRTRHYATVAREIGRRIEDELRIRCIKDNDYLAWTRLCLFGGRHKRGRAQDVRAAGRATVRFRGIPWGGWSHERHVQVGVVLLELLIRSTALVSVERREQWGGGGRQYRVRLILEPAEETITWLELAHLRAEKHTLRHRPIEVAPAPWNDELEGGGYHLEGIQYRLVKEPRGGWERRAPVVAKAANVLQETAWRVNARVLAVAKAVWERQVEVAGIPPAGAVPKPPYPGEENENRLRSWKREMAALYRGDERRQSKRLRAASTLEQAAQAEELEELFFPQRCDFRGRVYPRATVLGWLGGDLSRGLLEFARGEPWSEDGKRETRWLASHVAACWGLSRASYEVRVAWVKKHRQEILSTASGPLAHRGFWTGAKEPWQFLAACMAWSDLELGAGDAHLRLPVSIDASANGLQIYSLLSRDEELARRVNVVPGEAPSDIYTRIASAATEVLSSEEDEEKAVWASTWLAMMGGAVTREMAKTAAMGLVYGAERLALRNQVVQWYEDQVRRDFGGRYWRPCIYLADRLYDATAETAPRAFEIVRWFRDTGRALAKAGEELRWTSPSGFLVITDRREQGSTLITTAVGEVTRAITAATDLEQLNPRAQARAFAPNYVHSLDAAILHLVVGRLAEKGVRSIGTAHDAFAVPCAQIGLLHAELHRAYREVFERDRIAELCATITKEPGLIPPLPAYGELDPGVVASSPYLFS